MLSNELVESEVKLTQELYKSLFEEVQSIADEYKLAGSEEDMHKLEQRMKEVAKTVNDVRSCKDHAVMADEIRIEIEKLSVELEKLEFQRKESKKSRIFDGVKTFVVAAFGFVGTMVGIKATRDNMKVLSEYEKEHYVATQAEKKALSDGCDVTGFVKKVESSFGLKK